jgi:hypothetical protein
MATEQDRVVHLACDFLHAYMTRDGGLVPCDAQFVELTEGNFLTSDVIAGMLAKLRGRSFDQVLDGLPKRDEGYPPDPAATSMWATAVAQLKNVHVYGCKAARPQPPRDYDLPTAFGAPSTSSSPWPSSSPPKPIRAPDSWRNCSEIPTPPRCR